MSSIPVVQSRRPRSESSSARGGTLTLDTTPPARVALSRRFPPKKHTRKSCFGINRHNLSQKGLSSSIERGDRNLQLAMRFRRVAFRNELCCVDEARFETRLDEVIMDRLDGVFIHLQAY